jgi:predicted ArsR family transcriptional regulator
MVNRGIPQEAVELNLNWIDSLENSLGDCGNPDLTKEVMKAAGKKCSIQIYDECMQILGKHPESADDLLDAMNKRRSQKHNLSTLWEKQGNTARLILEECNCILVKAGLAKPNPTHCLCSQGMMESLFSKVHNGTVNVELLKSIGNGHDACEFFVTFLE